MSGELNAPSLTSESVAADRLESWKAIAAYLGRDVRTVQRWETDEGLPVHRLPHKKLGSVFAYKSEIDDWRANAASRAAVAETTAATIVSQNSLNGSPAIPLTTASTLPSRFWPRSFLRLGLVFLAAALLALLLEVTVFSPPVPRIVSVRPVGSGVFWKSSVASDGIRAYYTELVSGSPHTASIPVGVGFGAPTEIPIALAHPRILDASSNGGQLLVIDSEFGAPGALEAINVSDGGLRKFSDVAASCAAWSPKDDWAAVCDGPSVLRAQENEPTEQLARFAGIADSIAWSPDGKSLAIVVRGPDPGGNPGTHTAGLSLWKLDLVSRKLAPIALPASVGENCGASLAWAGDDLALAARCLQESSLWLLPQRGKLWTKNPAWVQLDSNFARIAQLLPTRNRDELLLEEEESGPAQLVSFNPQFDAWAPRSFATNPVELDYSRDGRWLTYVEYPQRTLWRARADGSERQQLTFPPLRVQLPHWSPDGRTVAFTAMQPGEPWRVYLVNADGKNLHPAIAGAASDQGSPTWSPDGRQLVFGDIGVADPQEHFIRLVDLRTGKLTKLPDSAELRTARWSPDGRYIAAIRYQKAQLSLFDTDTRKWTDVASGVTGDTLNWSQDSRFVYFDSPFEPASGIYRYDLNTRSVNLALAYGSFRRNPAVMNDVSGFSLAPDGSITFRGSAQSSRLYLVRLQH